MSQSSFIGVDIGTSGARAIILTKERSVLATGECEFTDDHDRRLPTSWWRCTKHAIRSALSHTDPNKVEAIAVSATSGTVMAVDAAFRPLPRIFMYSDRCSDPSIIDRIKDQAPKWTPATSGAGGLSAVLELLKDDPELVLHQADWINYKLTGQFVGDTSSALKSGYDPNLGAWPDWVSELGYSERKRAKTITSGTQMATLCSTASNTLGLPSDVRVVAGTTDGCASFLATGASKIGDGVSVLGTTLTIKLLSEHPIFDASSGVYSHRIGERYWLVGGASNTGVGALLNHFTLSELRSLGSKTDTTQRTKLNYYPLRGVGERFPIADPEMTSRHEPRPKNDEVFFHGLLEGITRVEADSYALLKKLGAPELKRIFATGGGTKNKAWMSVRERELKAITKGAVSVDAAFGSALFAMAD